jgi:phage baseplate assembly protein V
MGLADDVKRLVAPLRTRVANLLAIGIVKLVDDTTVRQILQVETDEGRPLDDVERFQGYGFASHPPDYAEALVFQVGGDQGHLFALLDASAGRPALAAGESAMYTDEDTDVEATRHVIHLKAGRLIFIRGAMTQIGTDAGSKALAYLQALTDLKTAVAAAVIKTAIAGWTPTGTTKLKAE